MTRFPSDRGLLLRMLAVMLFLATALGGALAVLVVVLKLWGLLIAVLVTGLLLLSWFSSGAMSARAVGGRLVTPVWHPELLGILERLCLLSEVPRPRLAIAKDPAPNAYLLGRPKHAMLVLTEGLLDQLNQREVEAVIAHEVMHLVNRDSAVMNAANSAATVRKALGGFLREGDSVRAEIPAAAGWLFFGLVSVICFLPVRLLSRYRELCADSAAAQLTQQPGNLASALQKITEGSELIPTADIRTPASVAVLSIIPLVGKQRRGLAASHPRLDVRIQRLARIGAELGRPLG